MYLSSVCQTGVKCKYCNVLLFLFSFCMTEKKKLEGLAWGEKIRYEIVYFKDKSLKLDLYLLIVSLFYT